MAKLSAEQIVKELDRRAKRDPLSKRLAHYLPGETQSQFHLSNAYFKLLTGGGRSGKTTASLVDLAWCLRGIHPHKANYGPITALVFCVSRQQAAMVAQRKLFTACEFPGEIGHYPLIPKHEIQEIGSTKVGFRCIYHVKMKNSSQVYFSWSDTDDVWKKIQGVKIDYIYIDENAGNKKLLLECRKRLIDTQSDPAKKPWGGCLTWGATGTEINEAFEDFRERCQDRDNVDHAMFQIKAGENKALSSEAVERFAATLTEEERKIHVTGEMTAAGLVLIYGKQWNDDRHLVRPDYQIHPLDNIWMAYDPGVDHPMGMLIGVINRHEPRTVNVTRCWTYRGGTIDHDIAELLKYLEGRRLAGIVYDTNLKNKDRGGGPSVLVQFKQKLMEAGVQLPAGWWQSRKRHEPGIALVRHYLDPRLDHPNWPPMIRVNASDDSGGPRLRHQILAYRGKEETRFTGEGGVVKKNDELVDCLRYLVMQRPTWAPDFACGEATGTIALPPPEANTGPEDIILSFEQERQQRLMALSRKAAQLRRRGGARVVSF